MRCLLTTARFGSKLRRMRPTILTMLLLACGLAFGQQFEDVSAKGSPAREASFRARRIWITPLKPTRWLLRKNALPV
jgi:hypothetical protein